MIENTLKKKKALIAITVPEKKIFLRDPQKSVVISNM